MYTYEEVMSYVNEEDVKFIRLAFFDLYGNQKNISIMPAELKRAFDDGVGFDASAVDGFGDVVKSDLFLHPDPSTLSVLPWRPSDGRVVRMFCDICYPDGSLYERDGRYILKQAINKAKQKGINFYFGSEFEFYLFKTDEDGNATDEPFDNAGYMDIAPSDKGENVRREICLTLLDMGIRPESSHHEDGPGQNEIDFKYSGPLTAADNAETLKAVVKTVATQNGLFADFSPKPLIKHSGNGMHINISVKSKDAKDYTNNVIAGIMEHISEITVFLNTVENSYKRLGEDKAPKYVTWSRENRSQLIRIPAAKGEFERIELRSPDAMCNIYLAYAMLIYAALDGIEKDLLLADALDINLFNAPKEITDTLESLPTSLEDAWHKANNSDFVKNILPKGYLDLLK